MLVKEYRILIPLSVEEYRIAQLYMIQVKFFFHLFYFHFLLYIYFHLLFFFIFFRNIKYAVYQFKTKKFALVLTSLLREMSANLYLFVCVIVFVFSLQFLFESDSLDKRIEFCICH